MLQKYIKKNLHLIHFCWFHQTLNESSPVKRTLSHLSYKATLHLQSSVPLTARSGLLVRRRETSIWSNNEAK